MTKNWDNATEVQSNWFKFENVGDKIKGTLLNKEFKKSQDPNFPDQWVYTLRTEEGEEWFVAISVSKAGTIQRLNSRKIGEVIGVLFDKEIEPSKKGFQPAKSLKVVSFGMDEGYNEFAEAKQVDAEDSENLPFNDKIPEGMDL